MATMRSSVMVRRATPADRPGPGCCPIFMAATAIIGLRVSNARGDIHSPEPKPEPGAGIDRAICRWTDKRPEDCRPDADAILLTAAKTGADPQDLTALAAEIYARSLPDTPGRGGGHPDPGAALPRCTPRGDAVAVILHRD
jgi:hypothetical protein